MVTEVKFRNHFFLFNVQNKNQKLLYIMSKKNLKITIVVILLAVAGAAGYALYLFNLPADKNVSNVDFTIKAEVLLDEFIKDEETAKKKYTGKDLAITEALVNDMEKAGESHNVYIKCGDKGLISCNFDTKEAPKVKNGDKITIWGQFNGFSIGDPDMMEETNIQMSKCSLGE